MLKNYLILTWRNLLKNKVFSLITIIGLATGLLGSLLIFIYVSFERSFDACYPDADRIYRLINIRHYNSHTDESAGCVVQLGPVLKETFPEVEQFTRCFITTGIFSWQDKLFKEEQVLFADSTFFDIFNLHFISKTSTLPLAGTNTAVITQKLALKYFGTEDPLGKVLMLDGRVPYVVEGVIQNVPENSHIRYDIVLSFITLLSKENYCFGCNNRATYIRLAPNTNYLNLESKLPDIVKAIHNDQGFSREYKLQPLKDIHLRSNLRFELSKNGSIRQIRILSLVALLVLLISWLNYINLSTSLLINRMKEIGLRKVFGAARHKLATQFIIESISLFILVLVLDITILQIMSPLIYAEFNVHVLEYAFNNPLLIGVILFIYLVAALFSGFISAYILAPVNLISAFKKKLVVKAGNMPIRRILVLVQYAITMVLTGTSVVIFKQNKFLLNHDLGIDLKSVIVAPSPSIIKPDEDYHSTMKSFMDELLNDAQIKEVSFCSTIPGNENGDVGGGYGSSIDGRIQLYNYDVALNYFGFFKIPLLCGRFSNKYDMFDCVPPCHAETELVINKSAVSLLGFGHPDSAIGKLLFNDGLPCGTVIGVVDDFNQQSLKNNANPSIFRCFERMKFVLIRSDVDDQTDAISSIKPIYKSFFPENPPEFFYLEDHFNLQYKEDKYFAGLFALFSALAIIITCLGLFGMVLFDSKLKTKEIGIRKVNGAATGTITILLLKDNFKLILVAALFAIPLTNMLMQKWLSRFAYQTDIGFGIVIVPLLITLFFSLITTISHIYKTAQANPIESLKYE